MPPNSNLVTKIKVQLKLSIARLRMVQQRDEALAKAARRTMAQLLDAGKEDSARIRVENIIRSDITSELHEILELYCELLLARAGLLDSPVCDPGLEEAVKSIIYAAPKTEIKELQQVRILLAERYGKDFVLAAMENLDGKVSPKVVRKLSVTPPREELVLGYLEEIAKTYGVRWPRNKAAEEDDEDAAEDALGVPPSLLDDLDGDEGGGDGGNDTSGNLPSAASARPDASDLSAQAVRRAQAQQDLTHATAPSTDIDTALPLHVNPPSPSTDNIRPRVTLNAQELKPPAGPGAAKAETKSSSDAAAATRLPSAPRPAVADSSARRLVAKKKETVDDELARRFSQLKR